MYTTLTPENIPTLFDLFASALRGGNPVLTILVRRRASAGPATLVLSELRDLTAMGQADGFAFDLLLDRDSREAAVRETDTLALTRGGSAEVISSDHEACTGTYPLTEYVELAGLVGLDVAVFDADGDTLPLRAPVA